MELHELEDTVLRWQLHQDSTASSELNGVLHLYVAHRSDTRGEKSFLYEVQNSAGGQLARQEGYPDLQSAQTAAAGMARRILRETLEMIPMRG